MIVTEKKLLRKTCTITFILILIALWFGACKGGVLPEKDSKDFRFVFTTDVHLMPHKHVIDGFNQAIVSINGLKPEPHFVIIGGDLVENRYTRTLDNAEKMFNLYQKTTMKFRMPVHNVLGNNDVIRIFDESGEDSSHPDNDKGLFKRRLGNGATYRSFDYNGWHFVLLDSIGKTENGAYRGYIDDDQLNWLKNDLDKTGTERPVCVALHIPLVTSYIQIESDNMSAPPRYLVVNNGTKVIKLLSEYNVRLVLQGHLHVVEEIKYKKTSYITGGILSGAKWESPSWLGHPNGFVVVDVKGDEFSWKFQSYKWTLQEKE